MEYTLKEVAEQLKSTDNYYPKTKRRFGDCSIEDIQDQIRKCQVIVTSTQQFNIVDLEFDKTSPGWNFYKNIL